MNFSLLRLLDFLNCAELLDKLVFSCFLFIYKYIKNICHCSWKYLEFCTFPVAALAY